MKGVDFLGDFGTVRVVLSKRGKVMNQQMNPNDPVYRSQAKSEPKPGKATLLNTPFQELLTRYSRHWFLFAFARQCTLWGGIKWFAIVGICLLSTWKGWYTFAMLIGFCSGAWMVGDIVRDLVAGPILTTFRWLELDLKRVSITPMVSWVEPMRYSGTAPQRRLVRLFALERRLAVRNIDDVASQDDRRIYEKLSFGHNKFVREAGTIWCEGNYWGDSHGVGLKQGFSTCSYFTKGIFQNTLMQVNQLLAQYREVICRRSGGNASKSQARLEESIRVSLAESVKELQSAYARAVEHEFTSEEEDPPPPSVS